MRNRMFRDSEVVFLSKELEAELAQGVQQGSTDAANTLVRAMMPLTFTMALRFCKGYRGMMPEDLFQDAMVMVLEKAVPRYKPEFRFTTYASHWVFKAFMERTRMDSLIVRVPEKWFRPGWKLSPLNEGLLNAVVRGGNRSFVTIKNKRDDSLHPVDLWALNEQREFVRRLRSQEQELFLSRYAGVPVQEAAASIGLSYHCARKRLVNTRRMAKACA